MHHRTCGGNQEGSGGRIVSRYISFSKLFSTVVNQNPNFREGGWLTEQVNSFSRSSKPVSAIARCYYMISFSSQQNDKLEQHDLCRGC